MARRKRFRRSSPDMGWIVDFGSMGATISDLGGRLLLNASIFDFEDIDELDTVMTKDKSDWFIKRVIFSAYPAMSRVNPNTSPARLWNLALHTSMDTLADEMSSFDQEIRTPQFYDSTRRILRTYSRPVYDPWQPGVSDSGRLATTDGAGDRFDSTQNYWGDSSIHDDFTVSNAGLVVDSSLYMSASTSSANTNWQTGDAFALYYDIQVLLQKRRGG